MIDRFKTFKSNIDIHSICEKHGIENYTINDDMSIDVNGSVYLHEKRIDKLPLQFREVTGNFWCDFNNLTSLKGSPTIVDGFYCSNQITSLEFGPKVVNNNGYYCGNNKLTSFEFFPNQVIGGFHCYSNQIRDFKGLPEFFSGQIGDITYNPVFEIYNLFHGNHDCIEYINEFDVIQGDRVIRDRLEEVYVHMGMEIPKNIKLKEYILI